MAQERITIFVLACILGTANLRGQQQVPPPTAQVGTARVDGLLKQMTLDEKLAIVHGVGEDASTYQGQAGYLPGIPRLGIPPTRFADGPPGVLTRVPSTALTATMGLAATFSREDARANGAVIGREARSHGIGVALQPFINIDRDFAFGRAYNTFGEDPYLTGQIGAAEIEGIQAQGVMAQAKHYIGYDTDATNVFIDSQTLHEVYAAPFYWAIKADVASIMCSYNRVNGAYACGNRDTLTSLLREQMGFKGFVTSDWGAVHATQFINAGTDLEMPGPLPVSWAGPSYFVNGPAPAAPAGTHNENKPQFAFNQLGLPEEPRTKPWDDKPEPSPPTDLKRLIAAGEVSEASLNDAARRILMQMDRFGLLDGKGKLSVTPSDVETNASVIQKTSEDAAVLLKNDQHALPLTPGDLGDIALIGPGARQTIAVGMASEKAVGLPGRAVGTLTALETLVPQAAMKFAVADDLNGVPVPGTLLSHDGHPGLLAEPASAHASADTADINYTLATGRALPAESAPRWTGTLTVPESGTYRMQLQLLGCYGDVTIDGQLVLKNWLMWIHGDITQAAEDDILPTLDGLDNLRAAVPLTAGKHTIQIAATPDGSHAPVQVRLAWVTPQQQAEDYRAAIDAARRAKTVVVFAWARVRPVFALPGDQNKLIEDIAAVNPNTVVVLNTSNPVAMPWLPRVKAVLQMWWPGDEGGWATARLLLGQISPAGRLPFTWPKRMEDNPVADPAHPERSAEGVGGRTTFSEGIFVGYRWFDAQHIEPLFPFGYGLSYSRFLYSGLKLRHLKDGGVDATFTLTNTGGREADEVAQAYIGKPSPMPTGAEFAEHVLGGFERIHLAPGQSQSVTIHIPVRQFQYWSTSSNAWSTPQGHRTLSVGSSSRDLPLTSTISME